MPAPLRALVPFVLALAVVPPAGAQTFPGPLAASTPNGSGLEVRASLAADAPHVHAVVHGDGLVSPQYRETPGGETKEVKASLSAVPAHLMLSRRGHEFALLAGRPGEPPQRAVSIRLALPAATHAGLTVCSHETDRLETAVFSRVRAE